MVVNSTGFGYFERKGVNFLYIGSQLGILTATFDFVVQYSFLRWGMKQLRVKVPGTLQGYGTSGYVANPETAVKWWNKAS